MRIGIVSPYSFDVPGGVQNHPLGAAELETGDREKDPQGLRPGTHGGP